MVDRRPSRTEHAYRRLLEDVVRGRWQAGDTLSTYALAEELGISRTPVLEALKRLESDGLVEIIPQVGCRIVGPSASSIEELLAVRGALEGVAAAAATRVIDDEDLVGLDAALRQLERAAESGDRTAYDELAHGFHERLVQASGMPRLIEAARAIATLLRYQLSGLPMTDEQLRDSIPEHRELFEAVRARAPRRARAAAARRATLAIARHGDPLARGRAGGLVHRALVYDSDEGFLATTVPFVEEGLDADERVLAVMTQPNIEALARALGERAGEVEFRDAREWYQVPARTLLSYQRYVEYGDRRRSRIIGQVSWDGHDASAISEWKRYESVLNVAFALEPVSIVCPYDARTLPGAIVDDARRTHPELCSGAHAVASPVYTDVATLSRELDTEPFEPPAAPVDEHAITADLRGVRGFTLGHARSAGLSGKALQDIFLAVQEVAANLVASNDTGSLRAWTEQETLVFELRGAGEGIDDPLVGRLADPALIAEPRGLWLARLLCDVVEARTEDGTLVVRLRVALGPD
jgi:DNA-binding GntR family transcriptional regulator